MGGQDMFHAKTLRDRKETKFVFAALRVFSGM